jgi:hypothetical protein
MASQRAARGEVDTRSRVVVGQASTGMTVTAAPIYWTSNHQDTSGIRGVASDGTYQCWGDKTVSPSKCRVAGNQHWMSLDACEVRRDGQESLATL